MQGMVLWTGYLVGCFGVGGDCEFLWKREGVPYKIYNDLLELLQNGQNVSALRLLVLLLAG